MLTPGDVIDLASAADLYLDLMKQCLTRTLTPEQLRPAALDPYLRSKHLPRLFCALLNPLLHALDLELARPYNSLKREQGRDWPVDAETMIGLVRLQNIQDCATDVLRRGVPGDFMETGVWRGGACIFMRAILKAFGDRERTVWVADSFDGLPKPDGRYAQDAGDRFWTYADVLAIPLDQVQSNFRKYGLLDDQVRFLPGWFKDTLPSAPVGSLAVLRLDGDMYSSTMDSLENLYPKLSPGGYLIVDDYHAIPACREATDEYRDRHGVREPIQNVDWSAVFWMRR